MNINTNTNKRKAPKVRTMMHRLYSLIRSFTGSTAASLLILFALFAPKVAAAGDASYSLSPASGSYTVGQTFTVTVSETSSSGDDVNAVQANLSYDTAHLSYNSITAGAFTSCPANSGGGGAISIGCADLGSTVSGTQTVATISFTALASGSATIRMTSGSDIDGGASGGTSVWNGSLPTASYTLAAPTPPPTGGGGTTPTQTQSGGGSSQSSSSGTKSSVSSGTKSSGGAASSTPTPTPGAGTASTPPPASSTPSATTPQSSSSVVPVSTPDATGVGSITITVTDNNGKPLVGATVKVDGLASQKTNSHGIVTVPNVIGGNHTVVIKAHGKKTITEQVTLNGGQNKPISVKLANANSVLLIIVVVVIIIVLLVIIGGGRYWFKRLRNRRQTANVTTPGIVTSQSTAPPSSPSPSPSPSPIPIPVSPLPTPPPAAVPLLSQQPTIVTPGSDTVAPQQPSVGVSGGIAAVPTPSLPAPEQVITPTNDSPSAHTLGSV